ncbi:MAG: hypothetical protein ACI4DU_08055 [Lachnospiraceae bacterium]
MKKQMIYALLAGTILGMAGCGNAAVKTTAEGNTELVIETEADAQTDDTAGNVSEDGVEEEPEAASTETSIELGVAPGEETTEVADTANVTAGSFTAADMEITISGVTLKIGDDFLPNVDTIGDAEIVEGQACLDGGYDTNYYYGGEELVIYTVAQSGKQVIYDIFIQSDAYATAKGATVGVTTKTDLYEMYGDADSVIGATQKFTVDGGNTTMNFTFDSNGVLESIDIIDNSVNG